MSRQASHDNGKADCLTKPAEHHNRIGDQITRCMNGCVCVVNSGNCGSVKISCDWNVSLSEHFEQHIVGEMKNTHHHTLYSIKVARLSSTQVKSNEMQHQSTPPDELIWHRFLIQEPSLTKQRDVSHQEQTHLYINKINESRAGLYPIRALRIPPTDPTVAIWGHVASRPMTNVFLGSWWLWRTCLHRLKRVHLYILCRVNCSQNDRLLYSNIWTLAHSNV